MRSDGSHALGLTEALGRARSPARSPATPPARRAVPPNDGGASRVERPKCRAAARTESPVGSLDHPAALLAWRAAQQRAHSAGLLSADRLRRRLLNQPELGRDHPHSRHRHRADSSACRAAERVTHARALCSSARGQTIRLAFHAVSLLPVLGAAQTCSGMLSCLLDLRSTVVV